MAERLWQILTDEENYTPEDIGHEIDYMQAQNEAIEPNELCEGCKYYCGKSYNGNKLNCAVHPYGWYENESCPDWEGCKLDIPLFKS